jgi:hypothetical protein
MGLVGSVQSPLPQQLPVKHCPPQQRLPLPAVEHAVLLVQSLQKWLVQMGTRASVHSAVVQQLPKTHCPSQQVSAPSH